MKDDLMLEAFEARARRRDQRRGFLRAAGSMAVVAAGASLLSGCGDDEATAVPNPTPTPAPTPTPTITDGDVLNFALNLEYLEAQFYYFAAFGSGLPSSILGGAGTQGAVTGGRQVAFVDPLIARYAREIAADERAHVEFLRGAIGTTAVAQPAIDIGSSATGAFSSAAQAAGLISAGQSFDPYASDENFLLGAYIFEDVGVTAYKGASPLISNKTFLEAAAGILAAEAYHAALVRTVLYSKGVDTPSLRTSADKISDARDSLDGSADKDQGISPKDGASNIVPTDSDGIAYSRTTGEVLNIVYLTKLAAQKGGFFPNGLNGSLNTSTAQ